jgi:hypothetical protein
VRAFAAHVLATAVIVLAALLLYDRFALRPALRIGVVDLASVYRGKEAEFAAAIAASGSANDRQRALASARKFAERLPLALEELPRECACLVVLRASVVGDPPNGVDLTAVLARKVGAP